jgi:acyl carrier protein
MSIAASTLSADVRGGPAATTEEIQAWLIQAIAGKLKVPPQNIATDVFFDEYGLDSLGAVSISGALGKWLHLDLPGTLLYEYPTIQELSAHLSKAVAAQAQGA